MRCNSKGHDGCLLHGIHNNYNFIYCMLCTLRVFSMILKDKYHTNRCIAIVLHSSQQEVRFKLFINLLKKLLLSVSSSLICSSCYTPQWKSIHL